MASKKDHCRALTRVTGKEFETQNKQPLSKTGTDNENVNRFATDNENLNRFATDNGFVCNRQVATGLVVTSSCAPHSSIIFGMEDIVLFKLFLLLAV